MDKVKRQEQDGAQDKDPQETEQESDGGGQIGSPAETMEFLLAQQAAVSEKLAAKLVVWVKVIQVTKDQILVDIGEKREGVVPLAEFAASPDAERTSLSASGRRPSGVAAGEGLPSAGQRIPVMRVGARRDGTALLSYQRAKAELSWEAAAKAFAEKARVRGRVSSAVKGGFLVDLGGVTGFLPSSLADLRPVRNPERMLHTGVRCYIIEINQAKRQLVLSRKAVLEEEMGKRRAKVLAELRLGEVRIGRVVHAGPSGLLVDIGGLEGFVRAEDVAWGAPQASRHERGAKVKVKVLSKPQKEGERVGLGVKQLFPNPADALRKKYPPKSVVRGKVVSAGPAGVKMVLDDKRAACSAPAECDPQTPQKAGDAVSAIVLGVNPNTFELAVSINKFNEIQDRKKMAQYLKAPKPLTLGQLLSPEGKEG